MPFGLGYLLFWLKHRRESRKPCVMCLAGRCDQCSGRRCRCKVFSHKGGYVSGVTG